MSLHHHHSVERHDQSTSPHGASVAKQARLRALPIERILLPLDLTSSGERAIPYTLALAQATNASITLAHVASDGHSLSTPAISAYLATIREMMLESGQKITMRIMRGTNVADALCDLEKLAQTDVVALAAHIRQGVEQPSLGKIADHLIRRGSVPVLLAPPGNEPPPSPPVFRRILAPLDGSPLAEQSLGPILTLAQHAREPMEIVLLFVEEAHGAGEDGLRYLMAVRERLILDGLPDVVRIIAAPVIGSPPGAIVGATTHGVALPPDASGAFDLLVMATHGRGGLQRWLYGSVAAYVMPRLTIPALLVHAASAEEM